MLTHENVLATIAALQTFVREVGLDLGSDDSTLSYLTLAHILGRALEEFALSVGASIGYWQVCTPLCLPPYTQGSGHRIRHPSSRSCENPSALIS